MPRTPRGGAAVGAKEAATLLVAVFGAELQTAL
jgi:hypothetical protein